MPKISSSRKSSQYRDPRIANWVTNKQREGERQQKYDKQSVRRMWKKNKWGVEYFMKQWWTCYFVLVPYVMISYNFKAVKQHALTYQLSQERGGQFSQEELIDWNNCYKGFRKSIIVINHGANWDSK